jgi:hypothetical protein
MSSPLDNCYQDIFGLPEICLQHEEFQKHLAGTKFEGLCAIIIDEMHCISQWGSNFWKAYSELSKLWAFFPPHIPILGTSATVPPSALQEVHVSLLIDPETSFFLNLGNNHPNLSFKVHQLNSASNFNILRPYLTQGPNPSLPANIFKSIVFTNPTQHPENLCLVSMPSSQAGCLFACTPHPLHMQACYEAVLKGKNKDSGCHGSCRHDMRLLFSHLSKH